MKFVFYCCALTFCLLGTTIGAPNVIFDNNDSSTLELDAGAEPPLTRTTSDTSTTDTRTKVIPPSSDGEKLETGFFPSETEMETTEELKAPDNIIPAGIGGDTQPRTFHHLAKIHHKIDEGVSHLLYKLFSPFLPPLEYQDEPHYFPKYSYHQGQDNFYRKDIFPASQTKSNQVNLAKDLLKPLTTVPQYLVNHPINFKQAFEKLIHHSIWKRSLLENQNDIETTAARQSPIQTSRQPKTLYKIIPNFEQNFGAMMTRIFGSLYGSNQMYADFPHKSSEPARPTITYTSFMKLLPHILQRMSNVLRLPQINHQ